MPCPSLARPFTRTTIHRWILLLAAAGCVAALHAAWTFTTDDAYISLRYARHWADGDGIRWNVGELERVEGYSNFLFVALGAAAIRLGFEPMMVLKLVGCAAILGTGLLLYRVARPWSSPVSATIPALLLWGYPFTAWWTTSGLETAVYVLVVVAAIAAFIRGAPGGTDPRAAGSGPHQRLAGLLGFVAALVRPEGPIVVIAMAATIAIEIVGGAPRGPRLTAVRRIAASFAVPLAIYVAWRFGHFGQVLPNPVHCKASHAGSPWTLLLWFAPLAALPTGLAAAAWRSWRRPPMLVCLLVTAIYAVVLYGVDPSIAYGNRHFLAAYALLGVPAALGVHRLARRFGEVRMVVGFGTVVVTAWLAFDVAGLLCREAAEYRARTDARVAVAHHLADRVDGSTVIAVGDVGILGYTLPHVPILDVYCLNNPAMTRPPLLGSSAALAASVLADAPAVIVVASRRGDVCEPRAKAFRLLLADPGFAVYGLTAVFGAPGDEFHYWVFERGA